MTGRLEIRGGILQTDILYGGRLPFGIAVLVDDGSPYAFVKIIALQEALRQDEIAGDDGIERFEKLEKKQ